MPRGVKVNGGAEIAQPVSVQANPLLSAALSYRVPILNMTGCGTVTAPIFWVWILSPGRIITAVNYFCMFWTLYKCAWMGLNSNVFLLPLHPPTSSLFQPLWHLCHLIGLDTSERVEQKGPFLSFLHILSPAFLITKYWYIPQHCPLYSHLIYSNSIDSLFLISPWQISFLCTVVNILFLLETECLKRTNYFQKQLFYGKSSYTNWS